LLNMSAGDDRANGLCFGVGHGREAPEIPQHTKQQRPVN
jgi:hypothetical protein